MRVERCLQTEDGIGAVVSTDLEEAFFRENFAPGRITSQSVVLEVTRTGVDLQVLGLTISVPELLLEHLAARGGVRVYMGRAEEYVYREVCSFTITDSALRRALVAYRDWKSDGFAEGG